MSYDLLLHPRTPDQPWDDVLAAAEEEVDDATLTDGAALEEGVATFRRIEARLRELLPGDLETWEAEETGGDVYGELNDPATGLQVELFADSASVSYPYREHADLESFHEQVRQAVRVVAEETGYDVYDPQTGADFDGTFADEAGREATRQLRSAGAATEGGHTVAPGEAAEADPATTRPADPRQDPAFLRRRGTLYLILGALLAGVGFWRLSGGSTGWLTWLVIVIGVFDLLGGLFMLSISRRIQAAEEPRQNP
ncbi:DUF308 domain-containing protein [Ornithinimicrobium tianjinense]|uniref:Uncharacterized protein n=1 Tax=Ornithinimicrobium tianjinense TaxID=1195761 RepID=A0A917BT03_9MICO|nr:DUF308 domain-containing protein [Ornithinimicrobium tianjinense]GGF53358.1 hypothetical protein GCM10011366_21410 [Ornithinimicrobium tianjinense]